MKRGFIKLMMCMLIPGGAFAQNCTAPALAPANNKFGFDMYKNLLQQKGVVFFSPYSIFSALQMTADGAKGITSTEMQQTLYSKNNLDCIHSELSKIQQRYIILPAKGDTVTIANSLWVQNSFPLIASYVNNVKNNYQATIREIDFMKNPESSRTTINTWVEEKTNQRIQNLLAPGMVNTSTRLILVNTIWLKAKWLDPFKSTNTWEEKFHATGGDLNTPFMHDKKTVNYAEDANMQVIELPYKSQKLSMLVFLPVDGRETEFAKKLTSDQFSNWVNNMKMEKTVISLPKFKLNSSFSLSGNLQKLGMHAAFTDMADFSGISKTGLKITDVIHKAFIEVDEAGTEAAAATAVIMAETSMMRPVEEPKIFKADRPFVFFLYDKEAKTILFMGKMEKPEK